MIKPTVVGFMADGADGAEGYRPTVVAIVTLLGREREVLYRGFHACGWQPLGEGWRRTGVNLVYASYADIQARPEQAAAALAGAASGVAMSVAHDFKR